MRTTLCLIALVMQCESRLTHADNRSPQSFTGEVLADGWTGDPLDGFGQIWAWPTNGNCHTICHTHDVSTSSIRFESAEGRLATFDDLDPPMGPWMNDNTAPLAHFDRFAVLTPHVVEIVTDGRFEFFPNTRALPVFYREDDPFDTSTDLTASWVGLVDEDPEAEEFPMLSASVPEPSGLWLSLLAVLCFVTLLRRTGDVQQQRGATLWRMDRRAGRH